MKKTAAAAAPLETAAPRQLNREQKRAFWAAWGGWTMDGMDSFILSLVLVPALREVLPKSGIPATTGNVGIYSGILFALFMIGWGTALVWGPVADRFGRARTLMLTILWFSVFTFLAALSRNVWTLALFRFLAGVGIGGEWSIGASLVQEAWPEQRRTWGACMMHTGYYFGLLLAALANYFIGSQFGWRWMFVVGLAPALLVAFLYNRLHEPERWQQAKLGKQLTMPQAFVRVFSGQYRRRTILNSIYLIASIVGLWAGSSYVPSAVTYLADKAGTTAAEAARLASWATALLGIGTIIGAAATPPLARGCDRRSTLAVFFALMLVFVPLTFGYIFYMPRNALAWFMVGTFFLGLGGANFAVYSFWLPEQYGTECRVSAFAFTTNIGRFAGAGLTYLVGAGIRHYGTLGIPVAMTAAAFAVALLLLPFAIETKDKPLPA
ncbi:MAG TPA: MFS transporter [Bryobacteraceae bacterium]|nr:MFS transporter [Bryobacteraceae bacterium]